ncbi:MAG: XRE family transcriptional regulator [Verrucomicrobiaceae bacterium]|nr:MAG: XRE family transcriptional regulator [Verrucomicrobiaceae bacterium]
MDIRQVFASNLRRARTNAGMSQEELAFAADLDRGYISSLERGIYGASIDVVARVAEVLGLEASELLQKPKRSRPPNGIKR